MSAQILYPAGTVMSSNYPLFHVLREQYKSHYCDQCFKESSSLKKCSGCNRMFYCDAACQKLDWKGKHKEECSLENFAQLDIKERMITRFNSMKKNKATLHQKFFFRPSNQVDDDDEDEVGDNLKSFTLIDLCSKVSGGIEMDFKTIAPHIRPILNRKNKSIGAGLYVAEACSTGYSCAPNSLLTFTGTRADLRAMTDLRVGQPITTGINLYLLPRTERRTLLISELEIDCHCEMCEEDLENDFDFIGFAQMKRRRDELREALNENGDLDCLPEYIVLMKHFYLSFEQRCKYHHPGLTQFLLSIYLATQSLPTQHVNIAVPKFDQIHPDPLKSVIKNMKITHDRSHDIWAGRDILLGNAYQIPGMKNLLKFFPF